MTTYTKSQQAMRDLVNAIPRGWWSSYADIGEALAELGVVERSTNRGALGRGAASIEDSMRMAHLAAGLSEDSDVPGMTAEKVLARRGYPWWRVRNDDGYLVGGGVGKERSIEGKENVGNVWFVQEHGELVGNGYASQSTRFDIVASVPRVQIEKEALCHVCFLRPCQCEY